MPQSPTRRRFGWQILPAAVLCMAAGAAEHRLADAVERQDARTIDALLARKADVNAPNRRRVRADWAAHDDDLAGPTAIAAGANANAANDHGAAARAGAARPNGDRDGATGGNRMRRPQRRDAADDRGPRWGTRRGRCAVGTAPT
jgi:hypothetical protein